MGYLTCRRCGARIDLPWVKTAIDVPPVFLLKCGRCGRASVYTRYDLEDVRWPTPEEVYERYKLRLLVDFTMFVYGIMQIQEGIVCTLRRIREELEKKRSLQL